MPRKPTLNARRRGNKRTLTINDQDAANVVGIEPEQNTLTDDILPKQSQKRKPKRKRSPSLLPTRRSKRLESLDSSVVVLHNEESSNTTPVDQAETHHEPLEVQVEVHLAHDGEFPQRVSKVVWAETQDAIYMAEDPVLKNGRTCSSQYKFYYLICEAVLDVVQSVENVVQGISQAQHQVADEDLATVIVEAIDALEDREELIILGSELSRRSKLQEIDLTS
ncbi:hypothetical protein FQR65_LT20360 [Abscondita terminalis]|nr:hypothetical protein FQR65_LT20360 [Abscondita terminalis]